MSSWVQHAVGRECEWGSNIFHGSGNVNGRASINAVFWLAHAEYSACHNHCNNRALVAIRENRTLLYYVMTRGRRSLVKHSSPGYRKQKWMEWKTKWSLPHTSTNRFWKIRKFTRPTQANFHITTTKLRARLNWILFITSPNQRLCLSYELAEHKFPKQIWILSIPHFGFRNLGFFSFSLSF